MGKVFGLLVLITCFACSLPADSRQEKSEPPKKVSEHAAFEMKGFSLVASPTKLEEKDLEPLLQTHANWVAWSPYGFIPKDKSEVQYNSERQWKGETTEGSAWAIQKLKQRGLKILLKPHIWIGHGQFTGDFLPKDSLVWQQSYRDFILEFAKIAEREKVEIFCIGTEMKATVLQYPAYFSQLIADVRAIYSGTITYAANWDEYPNVPFWSDLDWIGIDAYFPLSEESKPTLNQYVEGWQKPIEQMQGVAKRHKKPILFTEVGYRNSLFNGKEPWAQNNKEACDSCQEVAYRALVKAFNPHTEWFGGIFVWKYHFRPLQDDWIRFSPQYKPAGVYLQQAFAQEVK